MRILLWCCWDLSDRAEDVPYDDMFYRSIALQHIDAALKLAFRWQRRVENIYDNIRCGALSEQPDPKSNRRRSLRTSAAGKMKRRTKRFHETTSLLSPKVANVYLVGRSMKRSHTISARPLKEVLQ